MKNICLFIKVERYLTVRLSKNLSVLLSIFRTSNHYILKFMHANILTVWFMGIPIKNSPCLTITPTGNKKTIYSTLDVDNDSESD
jgi:hypothetical protein